MAAEAGEQLARCLLTELKTARFRVPAENGTNPGHRLRFLRAEIRFGGVPLAGQLHQDLQFQPGTSGSQQEQQLADLWDL